MSLLKTYLHKEEITHETYKDENGKWLSPDEIEKVGDKLAKKKDKQMSQ